MLVWKILCQPRLHVYTSQDEEEKTCCTQRVSIWTDVQQSNMQLCSYQGGIGGDQTKIQDQHVQILGDLPEPAVLFLRPYCRGTEAIWTATRRSNLDDVRR